MAQKFTITDSYDKSTYVFYDDNKKYKTKNRSKWKDVVGVIAFTALGIEETIFKNIIKLFMGILMADK